MRELILALFIIAGGFGIYAIRLAVDFLFEGVEQEIKNRLGITNDK